MPAPDVVLKLTFIRHGESIDNLRSVWAGWRDSPLSNHGKSQAEALAASFSSTTLTAIHSSPLKRALATAEILRDAQADPKPPLSVNLLLREQNFGQGEGKRYDVRREPGLPLMEHFSVGKFPPIHTRTDRYPGGESLEDVASRAEQVIKEVILPYVRNAERESVHVAFVSHGIFIAEVISALVKRDRSMVGEINGRHYHGLRNTGWSQVIITFKHEQREHSTDIDCAHIRVTTHNSWGHLDGLLRQKGGIGNAAYDSKQKDIRTFFSKVGRVTTDEGQPGYKLTSHTE